MINVTSLLDACNVCLDTVELFFPPLRPDAYQEVARHSRKGRLEPCFNRDGQLVGHRLIRNLPKTELALRQIDQIARAYRGVLHRFDVALEMEPAPGLRDHIVSTARLKWSPMSKMPRTGRTVYWARRGSSRNLALYDDKRNRITKAPKCVHLELRFIGARVIRRQAIHSPLDLLTLNPKELFDKHVKWSDAGETFFKKAVRRASNDMRKKYAGKQLTPRTDRQMAFFPRNVKYILHKLRLDKSQNILWQLGKRLEPIVAIPTKLQFPG